MQLFFRTAALPALIAAVLSAQGFRVSSGEYAVTITSKDVLGFRGSVQVFSFRDVFKKPFDDFRKDQEADMRPCTYEHKISVISLAGPYLSVRDNSYSFCRTAAHPDVAEQVNVYDLRNGKLVSVGDLFPEGAVLNALLKDPVLARHVKGKPGNLAALRPALPAEGVPAGKTPCTFLLPEDFAKRIALHHLEAGQVAIRMSLEPVSGACRGVAPDLGLLLPMPQAIQSESFSVAPPKTPQATVTFELK